ncbi:transposable element Tcb1 transposase [Trichonephila clavipes]|nr:transposable element Tcb1 transposase [Trichonephila clavipes]
MLNILHRHTGPAPGIMVWGSIGYHSPTPLVRIASTLYRQRYISEGLESVVLSYLQGLTTAIFQQDNADNMWHALAKGSSSITRINCFHGRLAL